MKKLLIGIALCLFGMSAWAVIQCPMTVSCVGRQTDSCIIPVGWNGPYVKKSSLLMAPITNYTTLTFVKATGYDSPARGPATCNYEGFNYPFQTSLTNPKVITPDLKSPSNRWKFIGSALYTCISPTHPEQCLFKPTP